MGRYGSDRPDLRNPLVLEDGERGGRHAWHSASSMPSSQSAGLVKAIRRARRRVASRASRSRPSSKEAKAHGRASGLGVGQGRSEDGAERTRSGQVPEGRAPGLALHRGARRPGPATCVVCARPASRASCTTGCSRPCATACGWASSSTSSTRTSSALLWVHGLPPAWSGTRTSETLRRAPPPLHQPRSPEDVAKLRALVEKPPRWGRRTRRPSRSSPPSVRRPTTSCSTAWRSPAAASVSTARRCSQDVVPS